MDILFNSPFGVFLFIILCSAYVCSILWVYGDAVTRNFGYNSLILPFIFILIGMLTMLKIVPWYLLLIWPLGFILWFILRRKITQ